MNNMNIINSIALLTSVYQMYGSDMVSVRPSLELFTSGLMHLFNSVPDHCANVNEVNKKAVAQGINTLRKSIKCEAREKEQESKQNKTQSNSFVSVPLERVDIRHSFLAYIGQQKKMQFLLLHGYLDPLLKQIPCTVADFELQPPTIEFIELDCMHKQVSNKKNMHPSFHILSSENKVCTLQLSEGKKIFRLAPTMNTVTCKTTDKQKQETISNYPVDAQTFHSMLVGNTKLLILTQGHDKKYNLHAYTHTFTDEQYLLRSVHEFIQMQLSPDEKKVLFISKRQQGTINALVIDMERNQSFKLNLDDYTRTHASHSTTIHNRTAQWFSPDTVALPDHHNPNKKYLWRVDNEVITPEAMIKLAFYTQWLQELKKGNLNFVTESTLNDIKLLNTTSRIKNIPTIYKQHIQKNNEKLLTEHVLDKLL
ncbi:MAG: hypothetical protein WCE21_01725 [Candidatus Babeliales bacterium]